MLVVATTQSASRKRRFTGKRFRSSRIGIYNIQTVISFYRSLCLITRRAAFCMLICLIFLCNTIDSGKLHGTAAEVKSREIPEGGRFKEQFQHAELSTVSSFFQQRF